MLAWRGHQQLDPAQHLELLWRWSCRWRRRTRSRDRCRHARRISAPERAIAWVVVVEPAEAASVARWYVVAGFHSVIYQFTDVLLPSQAVLVPNGKIVSTEINSM